MYAISGRTADEVWRSVTGLLLESNTASPQTSRGGDTLELLHVGLQIDDPTQRWVSSRVPAINPAFALVEVFWIAAGRQDAALPTYWNPALPRFCGTTSTYHGAYGHRLRMHFGFDQLERVYQALLTCPDSRQCVLQLWDAVLDLPSIDGSPAAPDIPCNVMALPKVRNGKLEWMQIMRSNDVFLGLPHNIVQFSALQEMLSGWLGVSLGAYTQLSDSLHIYARDIDWSRASLEATPCPRSSDSFALDYDTWRKVLADVLDRLELLMQPGLPRGSFAGVAFANDSPAAYENSVLIAAADAARRRGWDDLAEECVARCTNPALVTLWARWRDRAESKHSTSTLPAGLAG